MQSHDTGRGWRRSAGLASCGCGVNCGAALVILAANRAITRRLNETVFAAANAACATVVGVTTAAYAVHGARNMAKPTLMRDEGNRGWQE